MTVTISETTEIDVCIAIRMGVFVGEQGIPVEEEIDALDESAIHLIARENGVGVGTARLISVDNVGKIGRVCVVKSHRGTGLGAKLILAGMDHFSNEKGITRAYLSAQVNAIGFYEKFGFRAYGEEYDDAGIPHRDMERPL